MTAACSLLCPLALLADTHYAGGSDLGEYPYTTPETAAFYVQEAIDAAEPGDTVFVLPGVHSGPVEGLVTGPGIALTGAGPEHTALLSGVRGADGVRVSGFTFVDSGLHAWDFPASGPLRWCVSDCVLDRSHIECIPGGSDDELTVRRCVFKNLWKSTAISAFQYTVVVSDCRFEMTPGSQAVAVSVSDSLVISNCWFAGCATAVGCGEGLAAIENSIFLKNKRGVGIGVADTFAGQCTFFRNECALWISDQCDTGPTLRNCILWGSTEANVLIERSDGFGVPQISFSDVEGGYPGRGNIDADPMFFLPSADEPDLHLCAFSPCIDAGDPFSDYSNEPEPNSGRINMGAYGGTWEATTSELVDSDGDNLRDDWEMEHFGTLDRDGTDDSDGDSLSDRDEYRYLANPNNPDTDGDGLPDGEEVFDLGTNPTLADTDNDGTPDGKEVEQGTDPLDPWDALSIIALRIENDQVHVVHPVQPRCWYELQSSFFPGGPFGIVCPNWEGRFGVPTHAFVVDVNPFARFYRIEARPF